MNQPSTTAEDEPAGLADHPYDSMPGMNRCAKFLLSSGTRCGRTEEAHPSLDVAPGLPDDEGPAHLAGCVVEEGGIGTCVDGCPRFAAVTVASRPPAELVRRWITDRLATLDVDQLLQVRAHLLETIVRERETVWCEAHGDFAAPHFERDDCVYPHYTDERTKARLNAAANELHPIRSLSD